MNEREKWWRMRGVEPSSLVAEGELARTNRTFGSGPPACRVPSEYIKNAASARWNASSNVRCFLNADSTPPMAWKIVQSDTHESAISARIGRSAGC